MPNRFQTTIIRTVHRGYKLLLSPIFGNCCRFEPFCSDYALQALEEHGLLRGLWLAIRRVAKCQPYCKGGFDPVPKRIINGR